METVFMNTMVWAGILFCVSQSAIFSGLNLALLGISRLRLEVEAQSGNSRAVRILDLRKDSNFLLTTVLWGNVGINVLLTLLSNSVMTGLVAFLFSTVLITFAGEIIPQAYFSRHALRMGALLAPVLRFYQFLLYPVARPSALVLDRWLGPEGINFFREQDLRAVIHKHIEAEHSDVSRLEGIGAINFLQLDDVSVSHEGEQIDADSVLMLPMQQDKPVFPEFERDVGDEFLHRISLSGKKWIIIVDEDQRPYMALNANTFLRDALFSKSPVNALHYCHRPIIVRNADCRLGDVLTDLKVYARNETDDVIENDLILIWDGEKRVITGTDILGRLLRDIAMRQMSAEPA